MNCPNCKELVPEGARFCPYCGAEVREGFAEPAYPQEGESLSERRAEEGAGSAAQPNGSSAAQVSPSSEEGRVADPHEQGRPYDPAWQGAPMPSDVYRYSYGAAGMAVYTRGNNPYAEGEYAEQMRLEPTPYPEGQYSGVKAVIDGKRRLTAGLIGIFLAPFGGNHFYLRRYGRGIAQILLLVLSVLGIMFAFRYARDLVEGIIESAKGEEALGSAFAAVLAAVIVAALLFAVIIAPIVVGYGIMLVTSILYSYTYFDMSDERFYRAMARKKKDCKPRGTEKSEENEEKSQKIE